MSNPSNTDKDGGLPAQFSREPAEGSPATAEHELARRGRHQSEAERIQKKQGGHHLPPHEGDEPALDDTDRNSDEIIKPSRRGP